jgi:uncharacterized protein YlzI (FlbEa/FlbD family)
MSNEINHAELMALIKRWLLTQDIQSLTEGIRISKMKYTVVYNQLNGKSYIVLSKIAQFITAINPKFTIKKVKGKIQIVEKKMSAVEWLIEQYDNNGFISVKDMRQAKRIENENTNQYDLLNFK